MAYDEALKCRSEDRSVFELGLFSDRYGLAATVIVVFSLFLAVFSPPLQLALKTVSLTALDWPVIVLASIAPVLIVEGFKYVRAYAASPAGQDYTR